MAYAIGAPPPHVEVHTGEMRVTGEGVLQASALGSCVAVAVYDEVVRVCGLAHVMLPGRAPSQAPDPVTKYADDAIDALVRDVRSMQARPRRMSAWIAGGGNVLQRADDTLCEANVASVMRAVERAGFRVAALRVGGVIRRSLSVEAATGRVWLTEGDGAGVLLTESPTPDLTICGAPSPGPLDRRRSS